MDQSRKETLDKIVSGELPLLTKDVLNLMPSDVLYINKRLEDREPGAYFLCQLMSKINKNGLNKTLRRYMHNTVEPVDLHETYAYMITLAVLYVITTVLATFGIDTLACAMCMCAASLCVAGFVALYKEGGDKFEEKFESSIYGKVRVGQNNIYLEAIDTYVPYSNVISIELQCRVLNIITADNAYFITFPPGYKNMVEISNYVKARCGLNVEQDRLGDAYKGESV